MAEQMGDGAAEPRPTVGSPDVSGELPRPALAVLTTDVGQTDSDLARARVIDNPAESAPSESAPAATTGSEADEIKDGGARLRVVALPAEIVRARAAHHSPRRSLRPRRAHETTAQFDGLAVVRWVLALPTLIVAGTAAWATVMALGSLWSLVQHVAELQFDEAASRLAGLDASGRIMLGVAGYVALLFSLRAVASGLRASGWKRLRGVAAVVVALPAAWLFVAGAGLASGAVPLSAIPADIWRAVVIALLLQVIALAVVTSRRPSRAQLATKSSPTVLASYDWTDRFTEAFPLAAAK